MMWLSMMWLSSADANRIWELRLLGWVLVLVLGACVGSFLNVVVYRLPQGLSLLHPGSHCPSCKTPLGPTENIPILGWLLLRGRCRHCGAQISWRYPAVEALTMGLFALSIGALGFSAQGILTCVLLSWLLALALIDLDTFLLPEELTRSGLVVGLLARLALPWLQGSGSLAATGLSLVEGIAGAVLGLWLLEGIGLLARWVLGREAMGGGDSKLLALIGMWLGWQGVVVALLLGSGFGLLASLLAMTKGRARLGKPIPFGPYLAMGGGVAALAGSQLVEGYLRWLDLVG
ncbi:prepilin peptidase [Synechococcus sp. R3-13]|uniref:prepilin peptidase n=1 Tax=Synechococcus sp. R3-13 TaxID=2421316 RepID=UPI0039C23D4B